MAFVRRYPVDKGFKVTGKPPVIGHERIDNVQQLRSLARTASQSKSSTQTNSDLLQSLDKLRTDQLEHLALQFLYVKQFTSPTQTNHPDHPDPLSKKDLKQPQKKHGLKWLNEFSQAIRDAERHAYQRQLERDLETRKEIVETVRRQHFLNKKTLTQSAVINAPVDSLRALPPPAASRKKKETKKNSTVKTKVLEHQEETMKQSKTSSIESMTEEEKIALRRSTKLSRYLTDEASQATAQAIRWTSFTQRYKMFHIKVKEFKEAQAAIKQLRSQRYIKQEGKFKRIPTAPGSGGRV